VPSSKTLINVPSSCRPMLSAPLVPVTVSVPALRLMEKLKRRRAAVRDDQVRADIGAGLERVVDAQRVPDRRLKSPRRRGARRRGGDRREVRNALDSGYCGDGAFARGERTRPTVLCCQPWRDVAELPGKTGVDEEDVHRILRALRGREAYGS